MAYKISNTAMIIESDGKAILIADEAYYKGTLSIGSTLQDLPSDYFTDYFAVAAPIQGSTSGYTTGGTIGPPTYAESNVIDKFSFSSDGNASDVGDITVAGMAMAGQSSSSHGYTSGGYDPNNGYRNIIDKFSFSSDGNASDVGDITVTRSGLSGQSSIFNSSGYNSGGIDTGPGSDVIDKFPFSSDANATDVGNLTSNRYPVAGHSSTTHGYVSGGGSPAMPPDFQRNAIEKFTFSSDANATDVGDLTQIRITSGAGQSSDASGYHSGGSTGPPFSPVNTIDKFPFSSDGNASDVGDLTQARNTAAGQSSTASGYSSGGSDAVNTIDKFSFSSDGNATDVGDLTQVREQAAGQQV